MNKKSADEEIDKILNDKRIENITRELSREFYYKILNTIEGKEFVFSYVIVMNVLGKLMKNIFNLMFLNNDKFNKEDFFNIFVEYLETIVFEVNDKIH